MQKFLTGGMALVMLAGLGLSGCADKVPLGHPATLASSPIYRLGVGDTVRVGVYGEDRLGGDYIVASDGTISFPLIGSVPASGRTVEELRVALTGSLGAGYLTTPKVNAQVITFRPYFILGEVERPGRYPAVDSMSLTKAIATAGGYTYRANTKFIYLRRDGQKAEVKLPVDEDVHVQPGDVIRVGERYF